MAKSRNLLYVGGLENEVTNDILFAAFIPFGAIRSVDIPRDFKESKSLLPVTSTEGVRSNHTIINLISDTTRGFGFVEFENEEDCADAIENMEGAELFGRVLRCNIAKPMTKAPSGEAVWSADDWIQNSLKDGDNLDTYDEGEGAYGNAMKPTVSGVSD